MPFFHRKTEDEKERDKQKRRDGDEAARRQTASLEALERGGIPVEAQRRLDELRGHDGTFFTSDLTVNEFLLARQLELRPLSQVMGSSVFHVGWQRMPGTSWRNWQSQELSVISTAMNTARSNALARMAQEAKRIGAHAVIGVHVLKSEYEWASDMVEFSTIGTAVQMKEAPAGLGLALTNLSGQDFWTLYQAGHWPVGVVGTTTVYYVVASWQTQRATRGWGSSWVNQELQDFTQGLYTARHLAMRHIYDQAHRLNAQGMVGMEIEQEEKEHEVDLGNDQERTDMIFTFHALGTAIIEQASPPSVPPIYTAVNLIS